MSARSSTGRARAAAALSALAAAGALALAAGPLQAATSDAEVTVNAGSLGLSTPDFAPQSATLTGTAQVVSTSPGTPWTATDARGTGAPWSVTASATDLVSVGSPNRSIAAANLRLTTGAVTAGTGADPATGIGGTASSPFTVPTGPGQTNVTVLSAPGPHRGSYAFTPQLDITIPATAQPSHAGSPYTATLTVTIS